MSTNNSIDLLLINGNIATMNKEQPSCEAVAIKDGIIQAIGSSAEIKKQYPKANKVIDLKKKFVCPGFNDCHTHLLARGVRLTDVLLDKVTSPKEALDKIGERVRQTPKGEWVFGSLWDETNWSDKRYLTLEELDEIAPENPCFITRICGHLVAVNSLALEKLDIKWDDPDLDINPETAKPYGYISDALIDRIVETGVLKRSQKEYDEAISITCKNANALGITSATDNVNLQCVPAYIQAWKNKELTVRVYMNIPRHALEHFIKSGLKTGFGDKYLRYGGVKIFTDGSLGARTAALKEPYYDDPTTKGGFYIEEDEFRNTVKEAIAHGWQTATHAIGDEAIELILKTFETMKVKKNEASRHRIEHAEYLLEDQLKRCKDLGLILSMQPNFPGRWGKPGQLYEIRLGPERFSMLNNFRKILDAEAKVCFGSDNMPLGPLFGIWSVVAHPIEDIRITAYEALYHFTLGAAYSSFEEEQKGSIEVGKYADLVVLDKDILSISPDEIKKTNVLMTIFDGQVVYNS